MAQEYLKACPDCCPCPKDFPVTCVQVLVDALRGKNTDVPCILHCQATVELWAVGQWESVEGRTTSASLTFEQAADSLENLYKSGGKMAFDWKQLLATILTLVIQILQKP